MTEKDKAKAVENTLSGPTDDEKAKAVECALGGTGYCRCCLEDLDPMSTKIAYGKRVCRPCHASWQSYCSVITSVGYQDWVDFIDTRRYQLDRSRAR